MVKNPDMLQGCMLLGNLGHNNQGLVWKRVFVCLFLIKTANYPRLQVTYLLSAWKKI